ncbi:hypothetical protein RJ641_002406 [Dillenia turbinata]|uniref:Uncharacterized protein n=1 Tax=Dillenia turbinata TaxID=194707 RepID=A0AAN8VNJ1_9MAGN
MADTQIKCLSVLFDVRGTYHWRSTYATGKLKPVIKKAMVELEGAPFKAFASVRDEWSLKNRSNPISWASIQCSESHSIVGTWSPSLGHASASSSRGKQLGSLRTPKDRCGDKRGRAAKMTRRFAKKQLLLKECTIAH